jgi:ribosomal protein L21E
MTKKQDLYANQFENLALIAFSGSYPDLSNKPVLGSAAFQDSTAFVSPGSLAAVATSGSYNDLSNKPIFVSAFNGRTGLVTSQSGDYTATQVGLGNVTNNAQLTRAASDFSSFTAKATPVAADVILIEDSAAAGAKRFTTFAGISHAILSGVGTNTHAQIDTHLANTNNPHSTTATHVGLGNVTNNAQLTRAAGDFNSFTTKPTPVGADILLIENSASSFAKAKITLSSLSTFAPVQSVFGRTGAVVAQSGDYTASQVGLGNVTNNAQLTRAASDFSSFAVKSVPVGADVVLIEDSAAAGAKKAITVGSITAQSLSQSSATATADAQTSSTTYTLLTGMTITPPAGTYWVKFTSSVRNSSGNQINYQSIFSGGSQVAASEVAARNGTNNADSSVSTQAIVTVNGSQAIEVRVRVSGSTGTWHQRTLVALKVG